jgi:hypothetical protein
MPHFVCPRCALRAYSAAAESRCPSCETPLGRDDELRVAAPPPGSLGGWGRQPGSLEAGRFRRVAHGATREASR